MRVLFVSKPIVPPWNDGSKNLVRDIALNLARARATVMVSPGSTPLGERVDEEPVYGEAGTFAPTLTANSRVLFRLLFGEPLDAWHFVFAPNTASSSAAWLAKATQRSKGWSGKVVQTIASVPRSFRGVSRLLFGDVVVAQSEHTRSRLLEAGVSSRALHVIPPCAAKPRPRTPAEIAHAREPLGSGPVVLYPGDLEVSSGAATVVGAARTILQQVPEARIVLACRKKTARAAEIEANLKDSARALGDRVRFLGTVPDMPALLASTDVVAMPCDDLYGKVDVPLVLLEALAMGKPLVLSSGGPLESLETARFVEPRDEKALADAVVAALRGDHASDALAGQRLYEQRFSPSVVARAYDDLYG